MKSRSRQSRLVVFFLASRPKFFVGTAAPVLVGSALGYATAGTFQPLLFALAMLAIMLLNAGANFANDYFDHTSQNDWVNRNTTPFSGGRRYIQQGILSPGATLIAALVVLAAGSAIGVVIVLLTHSVFILVLGIIGLLGGFFYTASPVRLGYRGFGEFVIALLCGLLPVYGSCFLQTGSVDILPLLPGCIVGILIFLVILVNEFPDVAADALVNKRTLVVWLGVPACIWIYRAALVAAYVVAVTMLTRRSMFFGGLFYLFTLPIAVTAIKSANQRDLTTPGKYRANKLTILLHSVGAIALAVGFVVHGLQ
ncbi:MAG: 1,4-dihydroxy-2-naphthoate octaprenyltransferase [Planctomycetota bacterium]